MPTFRLAHLSDPHLGPLPRPRLSELAGKRALGFVNWHRKRKLMHQAAVLGALIADLKAQAPDHIAVTGDLVNIALAAEFAPATAWLQQLGTPQHVTLVPGNHDAYMRATAGEARTQWGAYMRGDGVAETFPFVRRRDRVALIGLSSAVPTPPLMATGRLGAAQLAQLAELLPRLRSEGLFRVVLVHHPPLSATGRRFKRLIDGEALRAVLQQHGAELVLHGHDHIAAEVRLPGPGGSVVPAIGVPSASAAIGGHDDPAAYNLYAIDGEPGAWRCRLTARGLRADSDGIVELTTRELLAR